TGAKSNRSSLRSIDRASVRYVPFLLVRGRDKQAPFSDLEDELSSAALALNKHPSMCVLKPLGIRWAAVNSNNHTGPATRRGIPACRARNWIVSSRRVCCPGKPSSRSVWNGDERHRIRSPRILCDRGRFRRPCSAKGARESTE